MANRKVKPTEDYYDFLPQKVQDSTKLNATEKNLLATLCFFRLNYSIYAEEHDGWFYVSQKELEEGTEISHKHLNRVLMNLILKKVIERKSGTNHRCTHYRLHQAIVELLPKVEGDFVDNDTLAIIDDEKTANDTLDKIRLDKTSQDKTSLIVSKGTSNNVSVASIGEDAKTHKDWEGIMKQWGTDMEKARTLEELVETRKTFMTNAKGLPIELKGKLEMYADRYEWRYAALRSSH